MNATRIFIGVLVVLAVLFVVGIVGGANNKQQINPNDLNAGWLKALGGLLVHPQQASAADLANASPAACLQQGELVVSPAPPGCIYTIRSSSASVRNLEPQLDKGAAVSLELAQKDNITVKQTVTLLTTPTPLAVYKDGGTLKVTCTNRGKDADCRLKLK